MRFQRVKNAKRNSFWGVIQRILLLLFPFLIRTVMINTLGAEYLGLGGLFTSILNVFNLAELGFGTAIVHSLYKPVAEDDYVTIRALLNLYKGIYRKIGCIILVVGMVCLPFIKFFIKGDVPNNINIYVLYILYLANTVISYLLYAYKMCVLTVCQRNDIISKINMVCSTGRYVLQIIILIFLRDFYLYTLCIPFFGIAVNLICAYVTKKMFPQYWAEGEVSTEQKAVLKKSISGLAVSKISAASRNTFDSIIISTLLGLTTVAIYNNYYYILSSITGFMIIITSSVAAGVGEAVATETKEKNLSLMKRFNFMYMWLAGWAMTCLVCLYQPFMELWVGKDLLFSTETMWLFPIYFIVIKLGDVQAQFFDAAGLWWHRKWYALMETAGNIVLNIVLGYLFGVIGILLATIITVLVFDFLLSSKVIFKFYFKDGYSDYIISQGKYMLFSIVIAIFTYKVCQLATNEVDNLIGIMSISAIICMVVPNVLMLIVYGKTLIFKESTEWVREKLLGRSR